MTTRKYPCGCSATGYKDTPPWCPEHGAPLSSNEVASRLRGLQSAPGYIWPLIWDAAQEIDRLAALVELVRQKRAQADVDAANLQMQRDDYRAAYNRVATAARAVTAELQKVGDETEWRDGDETDRVYAWYELLPLVKALDADIHQSRLQSETTDSHNVTGD